MAITFDSPITAVLRRSDPAKRKQFTEGLGLHTVGDLLRPLPAALPRDRVADPGRGPADRASCCASSARSSDVPDATYRDRRTGRTAYRVEAMLRTGGPPLKMTFFAKHQGAADWHAQRVAVGNRGRLPRQGRQVPRPVAAGQPAAEHLRHGRRRGEDSAVADVLEFGDLYPIYPLTKGVQTLGRRTVRCSSPARSSTSVPELLPAAVRDEYDVLDDRPRYDWVHRPEDRGQVGQATHAVPLRGGAGHPARARPATARASARSGRPRATGGDGALLAAFDERLPFELTAGQREIGEEIAPTSRSRTR